MINMNNTMTFERFSELREAINYINNKLDKMNKDSYKTLESKQLISHLSSIVNILNKELIGGE